MPYYNMFAFSNFMIPTTSNVFMPNFNFTMPTSTPNSIMQLYNTLFYKTSASTTNKSRYNISSNKISSARMSGNMGTDIVSTAKQYLGFKESDSSFKLFTGGANHAWCADFVTYVVKEAYKDNGKKAPSGFGSSSVEGLRQWGKNNTYCSEHKTRRCCYIQKRYITYRNCYQSKPGRIFPDY